jgi:Mitochondrial carrier protein
VWRASHTHALQTDSSHRDACHVHRHAPQVIKQRLQVGQVTGNAAQAAATIVRQDGLAGLFVGGQSQLAREIPFNAIQFVAYDALVAWPVVSAAGQPEQQKLVTDALLGALAAGLASLGTQVRPAAWYRLVSLQFIYMCCIHPSTWWQAQGCVCPSALAGR